MRLRWTIPAADDLYSIVQRIQKDNPTSAAEIAQDLFSACGRLRQFPASGRKGRIEGTRELILPPLPYIVVYRVQDQAVEILRIYHGAQDWP